MENADNIFLIHDTEEYLEITSNSLIDNLNHKSTLLDLHNSWNLFNHSIKKDINNSNYYFYNINNWQKKLENFLNIHKCFPNISNFASLIIGSNINQYGLPSSLNNSTEINLDYCSLTKPLFYFNTQTNEVDFNFKKINKPNLIKNFKKEFKIIRIINSSKQACVKNNLFPYIDLKVRDLKTIEIFDTILSINEFWRNFHFITRKPIKNQSKLNPIYQTNNLLTSFYNPASEYSDTSKTILSNHELIQGINFKNINLSISSMASQLIFMQPGLILPLTHGEQQHILNQEPNYLIKVEKDHKNTHLVILNVPTDMIKTYFNNFSNNFSKREQLFATHFDMLNYSGGQYISTSNNQIIFNYEANMVSLFESLTKLDHKY